MKGFTSVAEHAVAQVEIQKSVFIAEIFPIQTDQDAMDILQSIKKEHYKARHHCYAFILGNNSDNKKFSDDGEPNGTAGRPILNVLEQNELTNVLLIVTRYFGGIKLGAGGLTRAYSQASADAVKKAKFLYFQPCKRVELALNYTDYNKLQTYLNTADILIDTIDFLEDVTLHVLVPEEQKDLWIDNITEKTNGNAQITIKDCDYWQKEQ